MPNDVDRLITDLARTQHGLVSRAQLRRLGIRSDAVRGRVGSHRLELVTDRVLRIAGAPVTEQSRLMSAVLDAGRDAVVSHESAAAVWRLPGFRTDLITVTCQRGRARHDVEHLATLHEPRRYSTAHVRHVNEVPVTTPSRTLFDLAGTKRVGANRLGRLVDSAWSRLLVSHASLTRVLEEVGGRGKAGTTLMREVLRPRGTDYRPPGSSLEARFEEIAAGCGFIGLERQVDVGADDGWIGRIDFLHRPMGIVFEIGDALFHGSLTDRAHDEVRWGRLRQAGLTVVSVDGFEIFHRRRDLEDRLRRLRPAHLPEVA
ncbi:MAG: hypothetical protein R8F63_18540 [Acidimicrobiales bacterium]|nr:hypothetical protein [Acidimicrobiales bacterium]